MKSRRGSPIHYMLALMIAMTATSEMPLASATPPYTAQAIANGSGFDVSSVRQNLQPTYMQMQFTIDGFVAKGVTLRQLIQLAYGISGYDRMTGERSWVDMDYFDVEAKIDSAFSSTYKDLSLDQRKSMLRSLLADRFALHVHRAMAVRPVYALTVAQGGPKLEASNPAQVSHSQIRGYGLIRHSDRSDLDVQGFSMKALAVYLEDQRIVDRPVLDSTGLTGYYNFSLHWTPADLPGRPGQEAHGFQQDGTVSDPVGSSTIRSDIQKQLGLKLEPSKAPVEILVVDHAALPSAN